jgi:hypothetical protein
MSDVDMSDDEVRRLRDAIGRARQGER